MTTTSAAECTALHESLYSRPLRYRPLTAYEPTRPAYLVRTGTDPIGFATAVEWAPDIVEIDNLLIHPDWQRQGWGSALITRLLEDCSARYRAAVSTNSDLHEPGQSGKRDARGFYQRHGFSMVASTPSTRILWRPL